MKDEIKTSMLGRRIQLGWSQSQMMDWARNPENKDKNLDVATVPARYPQHAQEWGEVVNVYKVESEVNYDVLMNDGTLITGITARMNILCVKHAT